MDFQLIMLMFFIFSTTVSILNYLILREYIGKYFVLYGKPYSDFEKKNIESLIPIYNIYILKKLIRSNEKLEMRLDFRRRCVNTTKDFFH